MRDVSRVLIVPAEDIFPETEGQEEHTENEAVNKIQVSKDVQSYSSR
jgi:hypothetical protein